MTDLAPADLEDLLESPDDPATLALAESLAPSPPPDPTRALANIDPSTPPYPRGLVLDLALRTQPVPKLLEDYGITVEEFRILTQHPVFRHDMLELRDKLKEEGFSFRVKAQAQAEMYLKEAWKMVHDPMVPANVRGTLIQWTAKVAGLDQPRGAQEVGLSNLSVLAEQLKSLPDGELEVRVMAVVLRNAKQDIRNPVSQVEVLDA